MIDVLSIFSDQYAYSTSLANWSNIHPGQELSIMGYPEKYSIVSNEIISFYKDFNVLNDETIEIKGNSKDVVLDGDTIDCYFEYYNLVVVTDIISGGFGYKVGDILEYHENAYHDHIYGEKDFAEFIVRSVGVNGNIQELEITSEGKFISESINCNLIGGNGSGAIITPIFNKSNHKIHKIFSVLDVIWEQTVTKVKILESIKDDFKVGEIINKRHRLTLNQNCPYSFIHSKFYIHVEETPFLKIPLAKDNNVQELYNQAILTIDKKIEELDKKS
jgi:hypothetical protein